MIDAELDRAFLAVPAFAEVVGDVRLVGLAGTVATLVQLEGGIEHYDRALVHHQRLTREEVEKWRRHFGARDPRREARPRGHGARS